MSNQKKEQHKSKSLFAPRSSTKVKRMTLSSVLLLALAVCLCTHASTAKSEPSPNIQTGNDASQSSETQFAPKRQYFIAPRVGRSPDQEARSARAIWSSLEGASLMAPGQVQPSLGYPAPLRSSLLFLLGNRRLIGPRSSGLLPQARIGRRASPSGLLPQPRVGRRSSASLAFEPHLAQGDEGDESLSLDGASGQQEVAVAAMSDNAALNDAVDSLLMNGRR